MLLFIVSFYCQVDVAFQSCTSVYIDLSKRGIDLLKDGVRLLH